MVDFLDWILVKGTFRNRLSPSLFFLYFLFLNVIYLACVIIWFLSNLDPTYSQDESLFRAPEIDISELESLFSAASASDGSGNKGGVRRGPNMNKPEKVQLVSCNDHVEVFTIFLYI